MACGHQSIERAKTPSAAARMPCVDDCGGTDTKIARRVITLSIKAANSIDRTASRRKPVFNWPGPCEGCAPCVRTPRLEAHANIFQLLYHSTSYPIVPAGPSGGWDGTLEVLWLQLVTTSRLKMQLGSAGLWTGAGGGAGGENALAVCRTSTAEYLKVQPLRFSGAPRERAR